MRWMALLPVVAFFATACDRHTSHASEAGLEASAGNDAVRREASDSSPRCTAVDRVTLEESSAGERFDFGEGVPAGAGAVVGLLHASHGSRLAAIARLGQGVPPRVVDLGVVSGDDPPPKPFVRGAEVFAAGYVAELGDGGARPPKRAEARALLSGGRGGRRLTVFRVTDAPEALVTVPQASDESPAFDAVSSPQGAAAGALLAWDEDAPSSGDAGAEAPRGVIRVALLAPDLRSVAHVVTVSPDIADAERPRVALRDGGFWVAWIAKKREPPKDAAPELEAPGEDREYRWVELMALDEEGRPAGGARRLSAASGHVAGFDMMAAGSRLDALIALDDEQSEGQGGEILHVVALADGTPRTTTIRQAGAGRGTVPWVGWAPGTPGWLTYVDTSDHTQLVPLDAEGSAAGPDSLEPLLDSARPVAVAQRDRMVILAVRPDSPSLGTWLSCVASE